MTNVTGFTAARSAAIESEAIVGGSVVGGDLILEKNSGSTINAGTVVGPAGTPGASGSALTICTSGTRPSSPFEGQTIWETDTNRIYVWPGGSWRWIWSQNGEDKVRIDLNVAADNDATGSNVTFPTGLEIAVSVPIWAKEIEAFAVLGQAHQVTAASNTELSIAIGSGIVAHKRIRWGVRGVADENDIILMGHRDVTDMNGTSQLFRVICNRLSGSGALRLDNEATCYLTGRFTDA